MIDPRAHAPHPLIPRPPLPYVSRRALKRVKDFLPPPTSCRYCQGRVELVNNSAIYRGRSYGDWPYAYLCRACDAFVGLHPDTDLPLGTLADAELREARKAAKSVFLDLNKHRHWQRKPGYAWLANAMHLPKEQTHFGMFDLDQCTLAQRLCEQELRP